MRIYIDQDSRSLVTSNVFKSVVDTLTFKRGDYEPFQVYFVTGNSVIQPAPTLDLRFGIKPSGQYDGDFLTYENSFVWNAVLSAYTGSPSFNTVEIDSLLGHDLSGNTADDVASVSTMGEFSWSGDSGTTWTSTKQFTVTLEHDVIHGQEGVPTEGNPTYPAAEFVAVKNSNNHFSANQTINGQLSATNKVTATEFALSGNNLSLRSLGGANSIGITDHTELGTSTDTFVVGSEAGVGATNANGSNFVGCKAGSYATDAYFSNFVGVEAGVGATNANNSNFFGIGAGYYATHSSCSNFIGSAAGSDSTSSIGLSASNSNFFGFQAGRDAYNANNSIFIGSNAGCGDTNAANSIIIGNDSNAGNYSNVLILGHGAVADQSNLIVIGSTSYAYLTAGTGEVAASPAKFLQVKVNGVDYNIPLHAPV